ncbi:MAG: GTP-binding protein [Alphaproteobacteria bacterium]|nr:GTP-binding protein [Alphaproteobacteria bacterium]
MKIKTYTAPTMSEAMDQLRHELGENAIIVSTQRLGTGAGVRLTAAIEENDRDEEIERLYNSEEPQETDLHQTIRETLGYHALPSTLIEKIVLHVKESKNKNDLVSFASALDTVFSFHPLPEQIKGQAFMLTGAAGVGKTVITGKLATRACLSGHRVGLISADIVRAGAAEQLVAFTNILDITLLKARSPENMQAHITALRKTCDLIFIDMPAFNPFQPSDMEYLTAYIEAADVLPVMVMPAGVDPLESMETAEAFAEAGAVYLLATRLDAARRFGGVLAAADAGRLTLCEASMSPNVTRGLSPINAVSLARLLLMSSEESDSATRKKS